MNRVDDNEFYGPMDAQLRARVMVRMRRSRQEVAEAYLDAAILGGQEILRDEVPEARDVGAAVWRAVRSQSRDLARSGLHPQDAALVVAVRAVIISARRAASDPDVAKLMAYPALTALYARACVVVAPTEVLTPAVDALVRLLVADFRRRPIVVPREVR